MSRRTRYMFGKVTSQQIEHRVHVGMSEMVAQMDVFLYTPNIVYHSILTADDAVPRRFSSTVSLATALDICTFQHSHCTPVYINIHTLNTSIIVYLHSKLLTLSCIYCSGLPASTEMGLLKTRIFRIYFIVNPLQKHNKTFLFHKT